MAEKTTKAKLYALLIKVTPVFTSFYVTHTGHIFSANSETPFIIQIDENLTALFRDVCGEFKLLRITDIKDFKKALTEPKEKDDPSKWPKLGDNFYIVTSKTESTKAVNSLKEMIDSINSCEKWENFILSDNAEENEKLLNTIFKDNSYVDFVPKDTKESPEIILTKSLLPLVSEKNYTDLYYSSRKIDTDLYLIVFDFQFSMFRLYALHYYIPMNKV